VKLTATVMGLSENGGPPIPKEHHFWKFKLHVWDHFVHFRVYRFPDKASCVPPLSVTGC
jgi:hypothetical protein